MLILIDQGVAANLPKLMSDERFLECIDNLSIAHRKGNHIVSGSPNTIRKLATAFSLRSECSGTLRSIAAHYHEQAALIATVTDYVRVEARDEPIITRAIVAGKSVYSVPFTYFTRFSSIQPSRLVGEDSSDLGVYLGVMRAYLHQAGLRILTGKLDTYGGGGSSTEDQFRDRAKDGPTLVIVDSDRQYPSAKLGSTSSAVQRAADQIRETTVSDLEILSCHELENILPANLINDCITARDGALVARVEVICQNLLIGTDDAIYVDLKKGIRGWDLHNKEIEEARSYCAQWAGKLPIANPCAMPQCHNATIVSLVLVSISKGSAMEFWPEFLQGFLVSHRRK